MVNNSELIGKDTISISEAMRKIDKNAYGILFLVDGQNRLKACITDGDIRRHLIAGGGMTDKALEASERRPRYARDLEEAKKLYHKRDYVVIPIIGTNEKLVSFYTDESDTVKKHKAVNIPVVINAGGRGTRLDPFTKVLPKPLIPVGELPIIELIMKEYRSYGCRNFNIIVNYKRDLLKAYFRDNESDYKISWHDEETPLGTGGGLSLLRGKVESTFFFSNCDVLLTANYESVFRFHKEQGNAITMICAYKDIDIPYGVVEIGEQGIIEAMKEKPSMSFLINTGVYVVEPEVIDDIDDNEVIDFPDIVEREKLKGRKVAAFPISENDWMDMGQLPELERMRVKLYGE